MNHAAKLRSVQVKLTGYKNQNGSSSIDDCERNRQFWQFNSWFGFNTGFCLKASHTAIIFINKLIAHSIVAFFLAAAK
jgi:hypothetical protein